MISRSQIAQLAPHARQDYATTLASEWAWATMTHYGINSTKEGLASFLANVMVETGRLTIKRESLFYTSPDRLRVVWPKRFGQRSEPEEGEKVGKFVLSDEDLAPFLKNEAALGNHVYNGRMGNRPGTNDGFDYRGWGWLQCTGLEDTLKYCRIAGVDPLADPHVLNDANVSFTVACAEWYAAGCCSMAEDFAGTCVAINAGVSALKKVNSGKFTHRQACQSLPERQAEYKRILPILGSAVDTMPDYPGDELEDAADFELDTE